jgi:hypothetical protein
VLHRNEDLEIHLPSFVRPLRPEGVIVKTRKRKLLLSLLVIGIVGSVATLGTYSAFTATTSNAGNSFASGTVAIGDNDGGSTALYVESNKKPGDFVEKCIRVTYTGSLTSTVKLYSTSTVTNGSLYNLKIERGSGLSGSFPACTGFVAAATLFDNSLGTFMSTHSSYAAGIDARGAAWAQNDAVDYKLTVTQNDDTVANAHTSVTASGSHDFTFEARNN